MIKGTRRLFVPIADWKMALSRWKKRVKVLKYEIRALCLAGKDPRVPLAARIVIGLVAAYALSPIDLIPDFIPIIGFLDDIVLLPLGIWLAIRLIPEDVWQQCRIKAAAGK